MLTREAVERLKPFEARAIIEALRKGIVPTEYVAFFTVGRQHWLRFIEEDLEDFIAEGGSKVRFVNGDYGDGKTHFMSVVQQLALEKRFATSFTVLTRDVPIHKFEVIYRELVSQLRGSFPGKGLRALIQHWLKGEGASEEEMSASLSRQPGMLLDFAKALTALLELARSPLSEGEALEERERSQELLYQWFEGKKVPKKELKKFHIFETLNKTNSKQLLQSLIAFLRLTGHKGLIMLFDELETVLAQGASVRAAAYENVRLLMDSAENGQYMQLFFSLIPDVLLSERGFKSYDALWSRIRTLGEGDLLNYRSTLIDLHKTPLKREELADLGESLRKIHETSYRWHAEPSLSRDLIESLCARQEEMGVLSEVRLFIKQMIRLLDMAEQGKQIGESDLLENLLASQKEAEFEKTCALEPAWDA